MIPFLWNFVQNEAKIRNATGGEDELTASVNEENKATIIESRYTTSN